MIDIQRLHDVFDGARALQSDDDRQAYLNEACGDDQKLRQRIDDLLLADQQAGSFLQDDEPSAATTDQTSRDERIDTTIGPYELREQLAEGGMGVVYVAQQTQPVRRKVALKVIKPGMDTRQVVARFEVERQALAMMDHPHIARVFDGGETDSGQPFFVMELVQGLPITEYCDEKCLSTNERLRLFITVCEAVQHAHQKGIIHRDLKPTNVLVAEIDDKASAKVIDFGVAKAVSDKLTQHTLYTNFTQMIGTPLYMSPEQASMGVIDVDTRSDVYSLGVMLYELLTGNPPFDQATLKSAGFDEMRRIIREEEPVRPSAAVSTLKGEAVSTITERRRIDPRKLKDLLAGELDWLVMKALEKDRDRRYGSSSDMAADIERYLRNAPISARPPSKAYRLKKFVQRNRARLIPASIVASILMVALTAALVAATRERSERQSLQARTARQLYASQMMRASAAWEARDYGTLQELLQSATPQSSDSPDFRDWEWHFLSDLARRPFVPMPKKHVLQAAWNPRADEIAVIVDSTETTSAVEIWKPGIQSPVRKVVELSGPNPWWTTMAWSLSGNRLAVGLHEEGRVVVLDTQTGETLFDRQINHGENANLYIHIKGLALSPIGDILATGNRMGQIKLWDVNTGELRKVILDPTETQNLYCLAFSPDGAHLAATLRFGRRVVWKNLDPEITVDFDRVGVGSRGRIEWSEYGNRLVATDTHKVVVYQLQNPTPIAEFTHRGVTDACWIDEFRLASCGGDQTVRIWNWQTGEMERSFRFRKSFLETLDVSPGGQMLATLGASGLMVARLTHQEFDAFQSDIQDGRSSLVRWSNDGNRIVLRHWSHVGLESSDHKMSLRIFDVPTSRFITRHDDVNYGWNWYWSKDDTQILGFGQDRSDPNAVIRSSYGVADPDLQHVTNVPQVDVQTFRSLALNQELNLLAVSVCNAQRKRELWIYDATRLELQHRLPLPSFATGSNTLLQWSPNRQLLFVWCSHNSAMEAQVYDVQSGQMTELRPVDSRDSLAVAYQEAREFDWDPTSTQVAVGMVDGAIRIWNVTIGQPHAVTMEHSAPVYEISWSPSGRRIASCTADGTIHIWDAERGDRLSTFYPPTEESLFHSVQWSPDGRRLAVGGSSGEIYVLDAGASMTEKP